jgi:hypothetical protein
MKQASLYEFFALNYYEEDKLIPFIESYFDKFAINFETEEDRRKSTEYIMKNSKLSYSCAYNELKKLEFTNYQMFNFKKIVDIVSDNLCTDRYYILDKLFATKNLKEATQILDVYFPKFKKSELEGILTDLASFVKEYIIYQNTRKCIRAYNIYKIKGLGFNIVSPDEFLIKINNLIRKTREGNPVVANSLFLSMYEHFEYYILK